MSIPSQAYLRNSNGNLVFKNYKKYKAGKNYYHFSDGFEHVIFIAFSSPLTEETRYLWVGSVFSVRIMPGKKFLRTKKS